MNGYLQLFQHFYDNTTMNKRFLSTLAIVCLGLIGLNAQTRVQLRIDSVVTTVNEDDKLACVPVIADSFPNIAGLQFSVAWDENELDFAEVRFNDNPLDLNSGSTNMPKANNFGVTFTTPDLSGITLDPGTALFEVCFTSQDRPQAQGAVTFNGMIPPEFAQAGTTVAFPYDTIPGSLTYTQRSVGIFTPEVVEPSWASRVNVFPNPYTTGPLSIEGERLPAFDEVRILDMEGRLVRTFSGDVRRMNVSNLATAEYALQIVARGEMVTRLFLKQ